MSHICAEAFTGHRIVKAFGSESKEAERFGRACIHMYRTNMRVTAPWWSVPPLMELIGGVAMAGGLWYGSREIAAGTLTVGEVKMFITALLLVERPGEKL